MEPEARSGPRPAVQARPLAELLQCPSGAGNLLNGAALCMKMETGDIVFRQAEACRGLYVVISGQFLRRTERLATRLVLGMARAGDLVELGAALGNAPHTYTLRAQTTGSVLLLPTEALGKAFDSFPPLRMRLLEELAREVSRGYGASCLSRMPKTRLRSGGTAAA
jgi:CRP-like cAMP-binding protein